MKRPAPGSISFASEMPPTLLIMLSSACLLRSTQWKVQRTLAFFHELAVILKDQLTAAHLLPVFNGFLKDLDEVWIGVLKHLYDFLKVGRRVKTKKQTSPLQYNFFKPWVCIDSVKKNNNKKSSCLGFFSWNVSSTVLKWAFFQWWVNIFLSFLLISLSLRVLMPWRITLRERRSWAAGRRVPCSGSSKGRARLKSNLSSAWRACKMVLIASLPFYFSPPKGAMSVKLRV